jgi:hypothetical protein
MRRLLVLVFLCAGLVCPAEGKQLRATGTMFFCTKEEDLMMYVVARTAQESKELEMPGCMALKPGTRYTVLDEDGTGRSEQEGVIRVRIGRSKRSAIEGYLVRISE